MPKQLFIIAGPNGSGKTTLSKELLKAYKLAFVNSDEIAKELSVAIDTVKVSAGKEALLRIGKLFSQKKSFAIETTLSGGYIQKVIETARKNKYEVILIFVFLDSPEMCIERIKIRVKSGGHSIPDKDVLRRFYRGKTNLFSKYLALVQSVSIYYNGYNVPVLVAKGKANKVDVLHEQLFQLFVKGVAYDK